MMGLDNPVHIAFLLILLLLVFGAKRLPEMGRSLGSGLRGFKDSLSGEEPSAHLDAQPAAARADQLTMAVPITADAVDARVCTDAVNAPVPARPVA